MLSCVTVRHARDDQPDPREPGPEVHRDQVRRLPEPRPTPGGCVGGISAFA
ncbi:MAG: hypothetical protein AVDCRST_MAG30-746 [uncultured Solirubrobacteraceae bacterium]|uniref:Uncharacterized protein n=1 Tax=uncultured Solirubrobacteraceae bacterium TaxID=1162706 RepID=A0A6J4RR89_9ACTN|nr:MAG: hypothetical protein AVDCRST_MAG30-746 [uncultured Solirubrobacteraceae bacterium]